MIGTKRKAGRDTAGQAFAAEGNGHFTESRRLRQLPPAAPALALRTLCLLDSAFSAGCTIQAALQQVLEDTARRQEGGLAERDRHLAAELAYGTLRMENRLAFVLGKVLRQPLKLPLPLRRLLAVAAYGLLFLDRLPAHAVLHTAVDLARQLYGPGLAKVVNGSLRSVQRLGDAVQAPDFYAGPADEESFFAEDAAAAKKLRGLALPEEELRLARFHAVPRWLVALWQQAYGDEACRALLARSGARPWQALRVNASRPQAAALKQALLACAPEGAPAPQSVGRWGVAFAPGQTPDAVQGEPLARLLEQVAALPGCRGIAVGTRPDCLDDEKLALLAGCGLDEVWLELGLQTCRDDTLRRINRGHTARQAEEAVRAALDAGLLVCGHLMAGLPGEDEKDFLHGVDWAVSLGMQGLKLHNVYVPQGTELARQWQAGGYRPLARDEYVDMLCAALPRIPSTVVMQRIQADPAPGELLAPAWALEKRGIITDLRRAMAARGLWQGCRADATEARPEWYGG